MTKYITKRLGISLLAPLLGSSLMFILVINAGDPLTNLRESSSPNRDNLIHQCILLLGLGKPWYERYLNWLGGVTKCLHGQCDLGTVSSGQSVNVLIASAAGVSIRLVILATCLAIVTGVILGILTTIRQYSGFDYAIMMMAFVLFSLPVFWSAVLLRQYAAIEFNNWIGKACFTPLVIVVTALVPAFIVAAIVGGPWKRCLTTSGALAVGFAGITTYFDVVYWLCRPAVGIPVYILLVIGIGALMVVSTSGFENKKVRNMMGAIVLVSIAGYSVLRRVLTKTPSISLLLGLLAATIGVGIVAGQLLGGFSKRQASFASAITGLLASSVALVDPLLSNWAAYLAKVSRLISAIGAFTPGLETTWWGEATDSLTHPLLLTIALTLISIASYTHYTRASMLEVPNQDYIRTACSKGVPERKVITRHTLRNALIPLAIIMTFDFTNLIGGVVITEMVFAWQDMGTLFKDGLLETDPIQVMGLSLVTGTTAVAMNMPADLAYAFLDPRVSR